MDYHSGVVVAMIIVFAAIGFLIGGFTGAAVGVLVAVAWAFISEIG